ncbi:hypothetical protein M432DRAFT_642660 [Thermoascus aurantiacus ATCC 26904]
MPRWGRPPGARLGRQARRRATPWEDDYGRIEEIQSGEEYGDHDMLLEDPSFDPRRTAKMGRGGMRGSQIRSYEYEEEEEETEPSDGEDYDLDDDADSTVAYAVELAMMDREEWLVERALERIRRAHMLGKKNVRLSREERDALERKRLRANASKDSLRKKDGKSRPSLDSKRKSKSKAEKATKGTTDKETKRRSTSGSSKGWHATPHPQSNDEAYGSRSRTNETPAGYYSSPRVRPSNSSQRPRTPPLLPVPPQQSDTSPRVQHQQRSQKRHSATSDMRPYSSSRSQPSSRPPPDALQGSSSTAVPNPRERLAYEHYVPLDARYGFHTRSTAPGDTPYQPAYRRGSDEESPSSSSSDPLSPQRAPPESSEEEDSSSKDDDDDYTEDESDEREVQVKKVEQRPTRTGHRTRAASSAVANGSRGSHRRKGGRRK